jgi:outer membrane biosynthesis protein TonB
VAETRLVKDPDPRLSKAARHAVGQWRYKPVLDADGQPLEVLFTVTLRFALK